VGFTWRDKEIRRFFGLDLKTNVIDVEDGRSLDCDNVYQTPDGTMGKRPGFEAVFESDETSASAIDELGTCTLSGTKYWYKFVGGSFKYATARDGATTTITPSPTIATDAQIWCVVLDDKLFFVDGTNVLRYFNGSAISASSIYDRPTEAMTTGTAGTGYDYVYTVDNGLGESPSLSSPLTNKASAATVRVQGDVGPQTLVAGDTVRVYSRATSIAAASKLVATHTWTAQNVTDGYADIVTVAIADTQTQLYSELGVALNKTAPTGLAGITEHYGRLVGWKGSRVYNSKSSNPHSWPDDSAQKEAFVYGFGLGDGENIAGCKSYRESLYVGKPKSVAVFGGIGPDDTGNNAYSFRRLEVNSKGVIGGKTMQVVGEKERTFLVWLSRSGFMATDGSNPVEIGENIETQIQGYGDTITSVAHAFHDQRLGLYVCFVGSTVARTVWVLDVRKDSGELGGQVGWFRWSGINAKCSFWDGDRFLYGTATGVCGSQRVAGVTTDYADILHEYIETSAINAGTDRITVANTYATGDLVYFRTNGTAPGGLTANGRYYVILVSSGIIKLASSAALASAGTAIDITDVGSGTHSIVGTKAISGYYTTNWLNFGSTSRVKKLGKPTFLFNALAQGISLKVSYAYNWVPTFSSEYSITQTSTDTWGDSGEEWGDFVWGAGASATPKSHALPKRKVRSIRYKFANSTINQDFKVMGLVQPAAYLRNRGNFA
jgi:hypothetical protein